MHGEKGEGVREREGVSGEKGEGVRDGMRDRMGVREGKRERETRREEREGERERRGESGSESTKAQSNLLRTATGVSGAISPERQQQTTQADALGVDAVWIDYDDGEQRGKYEEREGSEEVYEEAYDVLKTRYDTNRLASAATTAKGLVLGTEPQDLAGAVAAELEGEHSAGVSATGQTKQSDSVQRRKSKAATGAGTGGQQRKIKNSEAIAKTRPVLVVDDSIAESTDNSTNNSVARSVLSAASPSSSISSSDTHTKKLCKISSFRVSQVDLETGALVHSYTSAREAEEMHPQLFHARAIVQCCDGKQKTHKKFKWHYEGERGGAESVA